MTAFLPPERSLGRAERSAETLGEVVDRLRRGDDPFELGSQLFDPFRQLGCVASVGHSAPPPKLRLGIEEAAWTTRSRAAIAINRRIFPEGSLAFGVHPACR